MTVPNTARALDRQGVPIDQDMAVAELVGQAQVEAGNCSVYRSPEQLPQHKARRSSARGVRATMAVDFDRQPVRVIYNSDGVELRGPFQKIRWDLVSKIAVGIGESAAAVLGLTKLEAQEVVVECGLRAAARATEVFAFIGIELPTRPDLQARLNSPEARGAIDNYLKVLFGKEKLSTLLPPSRPAEIADEPSPMATLPTQLKGGVDELRGSEPDKFANSAAVEDALRHIGEREVEPSLQPGLMVERSVERARAQRLHDIAAEVAAQIGGCTLKTPLVVGSPAWEEETLHASGKLAPKPKTKITEEVVENLKLDCWAFGFDEIARFVFLRPLDGSAVMRDVSFDEATQLTAVYRCTTRRAENQYQCQHSRAILTRTVRGKLVTRKLVSLEPLEPGASKA